MTFDVQEHMRGLPMTKERIEREIRSRKSETHILNALNEILNYVKNPVIIEQNKVDTGKLDLNLHFLAVTIDDLNTTKNNPTHNAGENAEILARLVGAEILTDFPEVETDEDFSTNALETKYSYTLLKDDPNGDEIEIHTENTRQGEKFEGESKRITTKGVFRYSSDKISTRLGVLHEEIDKLNDFIREHRTPKDIKNIIT